MKILFDHQIFSSQRFGGVSKYFAEMINQLPRDVWDVSVILSNNEYAYNYNLIKAWKLFPNKDFRYKSRILAELGKLFSLHKIKQGDFDVFHQTNFDTYCISALKRKPMVTTYHDVNFLTECNYNKRMVELQRKSLARADKIIAISQNTKNDMLNYFDIDPKKIEVIYHGVSKLNITPWQEQRILNFPYILYVGMRHMFKNFNSFVKAFATIAHKYPEVKVVCTRSNFTQEEWNLFRSLKIEDRMHVLIADEITLARLYRDALFFIFPSKYEGFGMPILEAMIYGCPTALAETSCFPEIAKDAALYFNPNNIENIAYILELYLLNKDTREMYSKKGLKRVADFSWEKCAHQHLAVYESLL